jgi:hypothetical protein
MTVFFYKPTINRAKDRRNASLIGIGAEKILQYHL